MARKNRTTTRPWIGLGDRMWRHFTWEVKLEVGSSGYVRRVQVDARHYPESVVFYGSAYVEIEHDDDVTLAIEACLVEASAMCSEQPLFAAAEAVKRLSREEIFGR